jgi:hypothetical protein
LLAAQQLGIPTATFYFPGIICPRQQWLLKLITILYGGSEIRITYYPIKEERVLVTGTPQFEPHYDKSNLLSREVF